MATRTSKKEKKPKKKAVDLTLWDVVLSYPDLHEPEPYKKQIIWRTDVLMEKNSQSLKDLREAIRTVAEGQWGEDKEEWPVDSKGNSNVKTVMNGNTREDNPEYHGKYYITPSTKTEQPPVVDLKGKKFNAQSVRPGMYANVAVRVSAWEFEGDEGLAIYLQGVQIDTTKEGVEIKGGKKSVKSMFDLEDDADQDDGDDEGDDEDEAPRKKKRPSRDEDEDEEEDEPPARKKKRPSRDEDEDDSEDEDDEPPARKSKKKARDFDDEDEDEGDEPPVRKSKKKARDFDDEDDE